MHYRYIPYPYYRRYYSVDPYYYRRYYYPYYNVIDSQIADVDQSIINYGDMIDVIQDSDVYQSMAPAPQEISEVVVTPEIETSEISTTVSTPPALVNTSNVNSGNETTPMVSIT